MKNDIETDYLVIGASYAGSLLAAELTEYGSVTVVDKTPPGALMNCGGGLPEKSFNKLDIDIPHVKINRILMNVRGKETAFPCRYVVVDRRDLNRSLFDKALTKGARFRRMAYMKHDTETDTAYLRFRNNRSTVKYRKLIFADGFHPGRMRITQKKEQKLPLPCGAAKVRIIEGESPYPDTLYFKITDANPTGYSWVFPMNDNRINIGAGGFRTGTVPDRLIDDLILSEKLDGKMVARGGGVLPVAPVHTVMDKNVYLFGDAAGMVYALNGEGLKHISDISEKWASSIAENKNLNTVWRHSSTYLKLRFAQLGLRGIIKGSKLLNRPLYPAACRFAAASRRIVKIE